MHRAGSYRRLESAVFQAAELPYRDSMLSMVVLLPRGVEGLSRLEKLLDEKTLSGWLESLRQGDGQTDIYLPRFEVRAGLDLMRTLGELGLRLPFDPKRADLSGMLLAPAARPWVSAVHHQSWVRVDERGTEAAAAEVEVVTFAGANKPVVFRVDHPFVFFIRHVDTGAILFLGRVVDPTKS
jgi:serpin B